ncbi:MAG TPA: TrmH family RNA methyltransferase [Candidatus Nanoarchaeia archaeon]|nr:TrmH family RNA methyltransferase [Candidatus Nanoarchaeia archaeon]
MSKQSLREKAKRASVFRSRTLVCVVENPKLVHNLMGIIRTAETLGVGKIYVIDNGKLKLPTDWQKMRDNSQFINLSASGIKWLFVKKFSSTSECLQHLAKKKFINIGTSPHQLGKKNVALSEGKYTQHHLAVWFGNEAHGLSQEALAACDFCIQIPMYGIIESMNLTSSASIVLNHIVEKRQDFSKRKLSKKAHSKTTKPTPK